MTRGPAYTVPMGFPSDLPSLFTHIGGLASPITQVPLGVSLICHLPSMAGPSQQPAPESSFPFSDLVVSLTLNPSMAPMVPGQNLSLRFSTFQLFLHHLQPLSVPSPCLGTLLLLCLASLCHWDPTSPHPGSTLEALHLGASLALSPSLWVPSNQAPVQEGRRETCGSKGAVPACLSFPPLPSCLLAADQPCRG